MKAKEGDRVRIVGNMAGDPSPLPVGLEGTVYLVLNADQPQSQLGVRWDNGRSLLLLSTDPYVVIG